MKRLVLMAVLAGAVCVHGEEERTIKLGKRMVSRSEMRDIVKRASMARTGGIVREAGTAKGVCVVLNAQGKVAESELRKAAEAIDRQVHVQVEVKPHGALAVATVRDAVSGHGGAVGVAVVDDETMPALLSAPEEGWAMVNVARLAADRPEADVLAARVRREVLRAFAFASGGCYAGGDFVMQNVRKPDDLDTLRMEGFSPSLLQVLRLSTPLYGLVPWHHATYLKACQEGWAPAPTNKYQKAIYEQVKAEKERGPANPIKIEKKK